MRKKILLVDDEPNFGKLLQSIVRDYEIRQAMSATEALAVSHSWRPDLFIIDLLLPDFSGDDLAMLICCDAELGQTPMVFVSAMLKLPDSTTEPGLRHGIPTFTKPFNVASLSRHLAQQLLDGDFNLLS